MFGTVPFGWNPVLTTRQEFRFFKNLAGTPLCVSHRLHRLIGRTYVLPTWEFDNLMKISTGEARWELIYTDRQTDRQTDGCG